ncbi:DNA polymerase interacting tetratricopeptide repeat-containing, protein of 47 kDa [Chironomus tepperi]|uniref:DNA polymerase interacting tetratricopeptide repeat-containing, protein of 47 kDa n=1 Tax=Chironomus tepperi TaxID=113505 RepID=UPI00391FA163
MEMSSSKTKISDDERIILAEKLDKELDEFIDSLEKTRYKDGWSEENWKEEFDRHPFFMKKAPEPGDKIHPMLEGLQQLKFDPEENTPLELAEKYKEDGNYWMKHKKYRIAIMNYTEGLNHSINHEHNELTANLYNNRSLANFFLKNYRSAYIDGQNALKYKSNYDKVKLRIIKCSIELKKYDEACKDVERFLLEDPSNKELIELQKNAKAFKAEKHRNERKIQMQEKRKRQEFQSLIKALIQRNVKFENIQDLSTLISNETIKPKIEPLEQFPVSLDQDGSIYWPIVFCYPEFATTDIQQSAHEMQTLNECLEDILSSDEISQHNYKSSGNLHIYFESRPKSQICKVDPHISIKDIVSSKNFFVYNGYLTFYVLPKNSKAENEFLNQKRIP